MLPLTSPRTSLGALILTVSLLAGCSRMEPMEAPAPPPDADVGPVVEATNPMAVMPDGPAPSWAPTIDPQMQAVIEQLTATEPPEGGYASLTPFQVRNAVLPAEAAVELLMKTGLPPSPPKTDVAQRVLPVGPEGGILVRTYAPLAAGPGPLPVIVYYHGGGWVIADLDTYEPSARALAAKAGAVVVSVAYRQAPEHRFPTAHEDAFAAYRWVTENAATLGGDPDRIATAGESAGGNLAVAVALMARDRGVRLPLHILSVYPIADGDVQSPSYDEYAKAQPLNRPLMEWFFDHYSPDWRTTEEPLIALVDADLSGLPPTTIINAEIDPLRAEGEDLAGRLRAEGIDVEQRTFPGVTHEFFGMAALLEQAVAAQDLAADRLKSAFSGSMGMMMPEPAMPGMRIEGGLRGPESMLHDEAADVYLVSNVNGGATDKDDNGFISKVSPAGEVKTLRWIDGAAPGVTLHAPKGMAISGNTLYVADIDAVRAFDRMTGEPVGTWMVPGATFLNDVSVGPDGMVYVTDTAIRLTDSGAQPDGTDAVYRFDADGDYVQIASGEDLGGPNGIVARPDGPVVVTFGENGVYRIVDGGGRSAIATLPQGQLDGLVHLPDGTHLVTSWAAKGIYHLGASGDARLIVEGVNSPADLGYDARRSHILLPLLNENRLHIIPMDAVDG